MAELCIVYGQMTICLCHPNHARARTHTHTDTNTRMHTHTHNLQDVQSHRLTSPGVIDLAAVTSLTHKFESSEGSRIAAEPSDGSEGGGESKRSSDKKKRHGL